MLMLVDNLNLVYKSCIGRATRTLPLFAFVVFLVVVAPLAEYTV